VIKLGKRVEYGLTALLHLHQNPQASPVSTHQLSGLYRIPEPHLGKVLQRLARSGLLSAVHGVHGGYRLGRPLRGISLGEVVESVESIPLRRTGRSPAAHRACGASCTCYAQAVVDTARHRLVDHLFELRVDALLPAPRRATLNPACTRSHE
jgi:Rrf2 family protein